ncbi:MAG: hypothetical protein P4L56_12030 [Candidatus Sulfopaludibacter sp.]|nr:hypothetical protein [Candidatus Sulfopaludibacter sp.]
MKTFMIAGTVFFGIAIIALIAFALITTYLGGSIPLTALLVPAVLTALLWRRGSVNVPEGREETLGRTSKVPSRRPRRRVKVRCVVFTDETQTQVVEELVNA